MIEEPPLLTIRRDFPRPSGETCAAFASIPTSVISDAMGGKGTLPGHIRCMSSAGQDCPRIAGPALTADCGPGDLLALLAALAYVKPGDIAVSAFGGYMGCAQAGDRLAGMMRNAGAVGLVTDGPVRDLDGIDASGLPVWAAGATPASPFSNGPGSVGLPIDIGGQRVEPGDLIVADRDGVVVVPLAEAEAILDRSRDVMDLEAALDTEVQNGLTVPPTIRELLDGDRISWKD